MFLFPEEGVSLVKPIPSAEQWENLENQEFRDLLCQAWKNAWNLLKKVEKTWNFNSKHGKSLKFVNSMFLYSLQDVIYKNINLYLCHIYVTKDPKMVKLTWDFIAFT